MKKTKGLHGWIRLLEGSQAAALAGLVKELDRVTASDDSSAIQLSELILKDASLTSHIIRIGNSIQFNPSSVPVTTVSRAIVNIGFKHVRSVCLAIKVMDTILADGGSDILFARLTTSLHAAHQARALCSKFNETQKEEAFVASLLSNLVELLILSSSEPDAQELGSKLKADTPDKERNRIAEEILGVRIDTLSKTLMKRWRIDGLINEIYNPGALDERLKAIKLGGDIAFASLSGWKSSKFKDVLKGTVKFSGENGEYVRAQIKLATERTHEALKEFGDERLTSKLPEAGAAGAHEISIKNVASKRADASGKTESDLVEDESEKEQESTGRDTSTSAVGAEVKKGDEKPLLMPDSNAQLRAISSMSEMMLGKVQINAFFKLLLEGLNKGVGLERNAFFLFDAQSQRFNVKLASGEKTADWGMALSLNNEAGGSEFLGMVFKGAAPMHFDVKSSASMPGFKQAQSLAYKTAVDDFIIAPLVVNNKRIGLLYADMGISKRTIDQAYLGGFQQFFLQARLALNTLANNG